MSTTRWVRRQQFLEEGMSVESEVNVPDDPEARVSMRRDVLLQLLLQAGYAPESEQT